MPRHAAGSLVALVVTLALSLLRPAPAASGADWETRVHGRRITCTVSNIQNPTGVWKGFDLQYTFCDDNYWRFTCDGSVRITMSTNVECKLSAGPRSQKCKGDTYTIAPPVGRSFILLDGTSNAQATVCSEQFDRMEFNLW